MEVRVRLRARMEIRRMRYMDQSFRSRQFGTMSSMIDSFTLLNAY